MLHEFKFPKLSFGFYGFILILNNIFYNFKDLGHSMGVIEISIIITLPGAGGGLWRVVIVRVVARVIQPVIRAVS